jgi:hypothetical protein
MPIKKIKNIGVIVTITKEGKYYTFSINPTEFDIQDEVLYADHYNQLGDNPKFASDDDFTRYVVEEVLKTLRELTIDKLNGYFVTPKNCPMPDLVKMDAMWEEFCQEFKDDETFELEMNECCVCFSLTKTKTNCGHPVCLECVSKIQRDPNEYRKNCPLCRQLIRRLAWGCPPTTPN